jgi:hypothetical protein
VTCRSVRYTSRCDWHLSWQAVFPCCRPREPVCYSTMSHVVSRWHELHGLWLGRCLDGREFDKGPGASRCLNHCLRHLRDHALPLLSMNPKSQQPPSRRTRRFAAITKAKESLRAIRDEFCELFAVALIYLTCELLIWGLSQPLRPAHIRFPACVLGMVLVFLFMCILQGLRPKTAAFYTRWIKSKVGEPSTSFSQRS